MAVNDELSHIKQGLEAAINLLKPGGRLAVITFHSIEDRFVKYLLKELAIADKITLVNKKVIKPKFQETRSNPRSRSAKLRVAEKL